MTTNNSAGSGAGQGSGNIVNFPPPPPKKPWEKAGNAWSDHDIAAWFHSEGLADDFCYVPQRAIWRRYDGARWVEDFVHLSTAVLAFMASIRHNCKKVRDRQAMGSAGKIASVKKILQNFRWRNEDQWDLDPYLLNCPTCTINLHMLAMQVQQAHNRNDYITKITSADPSPTSPDLWLDHIEFCAIGREGLIDYLQLLAGSVLLGERSEQMFAFFHGGGGNGKGVFIDTLLYALGDYAVTCDPDVFTEQRFKQHTEELMCMRGARLIVCSEIASNAKWNEARLKAVTGGDFMAASYKGENSIRFKVQGLLIFTGNDKPALHQINDAIKRRMHLVPFEAKIDKEKFDPRIRERLQLEAAGILTWLIKGCMQYQIGGGITVPSEVEVATSEYISDENHIEQWKEECCDCHPNATVKTKIGVLYASWRKWCEDNGLRAGYINTFSTNLSNSGVTREKGQSKGRRFEGIALKKENEEEEKDE